MADRHQRMITASGTLEPGQWQATDPRVVSAKALVACRSCGGVDELDDSYGIEPDGRVTPRWHCPTATCSAAEWLVLEAWEP
jgi:hypothetical protein